MEQLEQLLERVKAANGPDRELSRDIYEAVTGECVHRKYSRQCVGEDDDYELVCDDCHTETWGESSKWAKLTTSMDAALSLVERVLPERWLESLRELRTPIIYRGDEHPPLGAYECSLQLRTGGWLCTGRAATPPLAILAALLTALIAQKQAVAQEG